VPLLIPTARAPAGSLADQLAVMIVGGVRSDFTKRV
jgi:hypothetical protein